VLRGYIAGSVLALVLGAPAVAAAIGLVGLLHAVIIVHHTVELGRIMHEITDGVARQAGLTPVAPLRKERVEPELAPSAA